MMTVDDWRRFMGEQRDGRLHKWKASGGREIPICDLTDEHLINILNWLERVRSGVHQVPNTDQRTEDYFWLRTEAMKRGIRWRNYSDQLPLWDGDLRAGVREWRSSGSKTPWGDEGMMSGRPSRFKSRNDPPQRYQFPTYEEIARGLGGVRFPQDRRHDAIPLRDLKSGEKFKVPNRDTIYLKAEPFGVTYMALSVQGYRWNGSYFACDDGVARCFVTNLRTGKTYLENADLVVMRYEGHRIG